MKHIQVPVSSFPREWIQLASIAASLAGAIGGFSASVLPARGADVPFTERVISTNAIEPFSIFAIDLDGDEDTDVLSASFGDNKIAWYENDGGFPPTFTDHVISTTAERAFDVFATDLDDDGDIDVLSAIFRGNIISWYESDGGAPPTFTEREISTVAFRVASVFATDVDGDGDIDVLSASVLDNKIAWYENDGGVLPTFTERVISTTASGAISVYATDLDGDGDIDVLAAAHGDDKIMWFESDGGASPIFTERVISTTADGVRSVFAADLDGDGNTDVLSAAEFDNKIAWYENNGGSPPTFTERVISTATNSANSVFAADVDGDGDTDVLSASAGDDKIAWYENDGGSLPTFTERVISTTAVGANSVFAVDIDADGDTDVLSASADDDKIAWYENTSPTCGNGVVGPDEECEDGNTVNGDGCDNNCTVTACGNGIVTFGEECDDGHNDDGDGCSATCSVEPLSKCTGEPSVCITDIPAVSEWGLVVMLLLLLAGGTILIGHRATCGTKRT